jgi:SAM-dependent methyltransferase
MTPVNMDEIYRKISPEEIPWNIEEPPKVLVDLVEGERIRPCKAVDFGCGIGNHAVYLAGMGFDMTGVDISTEAIRMAKGKAREKGVRCEFIADDVLGDLKEVSASFDFAYDWELLHHLFPDQRKKYVKNVFNKLNVGGFYLSLCFSEKDPQFGGSGKYRETVLGTRLYFSSEEELKKLFESYFDIQDLRTIQIPGKRAPHLAIYVFMIRR